VDDAPGGGARFTVTLPRYAPLGTPLNETGADTHAGQEAARQAREELRTRTEAVATLQEGAQPLILIVEDNVEMRQFVAETLAGDYRSATARDGKKGLEKTVALRPDLVLTDVMMPRHSGDEFVRAMRCHPELDANPIVLLTAKADDDLRVQLLREGAQDYLTKPFAAEELRARLANLITVKRAREVLQREFGSQLRDLESLSSEITVRKRELQALWRRCAWPAIMRSWPARSKATSLRWCRMSCARP
jgi:CheY-like chemotaxis protein